MLSEQYTGLITDNLDVLFATLALNFFCSVVLVF